MLLFSVVNFVCLSNHSRVTHTVLLDVPEFSRNHSKDSSGMRGPKLKIDLLVNKRLRLVARLDGFAKTNGWKYPIAAHHEELAEE
jgi:hypothetical protein